MTIVKIRIPFACYAYVPSNQYVTATAKSHHHHQRIYLYFLSLPDGAESMTSNQSKVHEFVVPSLLLSRLRTAAHFGTSETRDVSTYGYSSVHLLNRWTATGSWPLDGRVRCLQSGTCRGRHCKAINQLPGNLRLRQSWRSTLYSWRARRSLDILTT